MKLMGSRVVPEALASLQVFTGFHCPIASDIFLIALFWLAAGGGLLADERPSRPGLLRLPFLPLLGLAGER